MATNIPTVPEEASRRGVAYKVANGEQLPNLCGKKFEKSVPEDSFFCLKRNVRALFVVFHRQTFSFATISGFDILISQKLAREIEDGLFGKSGLFALARDGHG